MFRFTMPDPAMDKMTQAGALTEQFDAFLKSDAMHNLLKLLDTDIAGLPQKYDMRKKSDGGVKESQEIKSDLSLEDRRYDIYQCFKELGFFDINSPNSPDYHRIIILGASLKSTYQKTEYSAKWITPKVVSVDGLTCFRPLNPVERKAGAFKTKSDTEFGAMSDSMEAVFGLNSDAWQDDFTGDRNLNRISCIRTYASNNDNCDFRIFAAPSTDAGVRRADTGDTLDFYFNKGNINSGETLLAITGNRYCNRQFIQLAYQILRSDIPVGLDVIGNYCGDEIASAENYDMIGYIQDVIAITDWIERFKNLFRG